MFLFGISVVSRRRILAVTNTCYVPLFSLLQGLISKADIEEFFNTVKLHDYEESIHHEIKEKQVGTVRLASTLGPSE